MVLGLTVLAIWVCLVAARGGFWTMREQPVRGAVALPAPPVAAVIPARNEAETVGRAVKSLAAQDYAGEFRIVLVDDASDDGTAAIARAAAPPDEADRDRRRARCPRAGPASSGRSRRASRKLRAATDYLLSPTPTSSIRPRTSAAAGGPRQPRAAMTWSPTWRCSAAESLAERALVPAFVFFFFLLYPPAWISNPRRRTAGAAGGCMLVRREALERIGGIAAHPRRTDRRLRPGSRNQALRRTRVARTQRGNPQHPALRNLRRDRPHDFAHGVHAVALLRAAAGGYRRRAAADVPGAARTGAARLVVRRGGVGADVDMLCARFFASIAARGSGRRCCRWSRCSTRRPRCNPPSPTGAAPAACGRAARRPRARCNPGRLGIISRERSNGPLLPDRPCRAAGPGPAARLHHCRLRPRRAVHGVRHQPWSTARASAPPGSPATSSGIE